MSIGTAIVVSIGIVAVAWLGTIAFSVWLTNRYKDKE